MRMDRGIIQTFPRPARFRLLENQFNLSWSATCLQSARRGWCLAGKRSRLEIAYPQFSKMRYREGIARDFLSSKSPNGYPEPISPPRQHLGIVFVQLYMLNDFLKRLIPIISALVLM